MPVVVAPVIVGLMALLSFLLLYALRRQAATVFGNLFTLIGDLLRAIPFVGGWLAHHVESATQWIAVQIGHAAVETARPITALFSHLAGTIEYAAFTTAYVAEGTYDALWKLRHAVQLSRLVPFIAGAAIGIPLGAAALNWATPVQMRAFIGAALIVFSVYSLVRPTLPAVKGGKIADSIVGLLSGAFSGSTGLAGIPVIVWASLRRWS